MKVTKEQAQQTALAIWNKTLTDALRASQPFVGGRNAKSHAKLLANTIYIAEQFEVTKHRVIIDKIIAKLNAHTTSHKELGKAIESCKRWQFGKVNKLRKTQAQEADKIVATRETLLIVVNTKPPIAEVSADPELKHKVEMKLSKN